MSRHRSWFSEEEVLTLLEAYGLNKSDVFSISEVIDFLDDGDILNRKIYWNYLNYAFRTLANKGILKITTYKNKVHFTLKVDLTVYKGAIKHDITSGRT